MFKLKLSLVLILLVVISISIFSGVVFGSSRFNILLLDDAIDLLNKAYSEDKQDVITALKENNLNVSVKGNIVSLDQIVEKNENGSIKISIFLTFDANDKCNGSGMMIISTIPEHYTEMHTSIIQDLQLIDMLYHVMDKKTNDHGFMKVHKYDKKFSLLTAYMCDPTTGQLSAYLVIGERTMISGLYFRIKL